MTELKIGDRVKFNGNDSDNDLRGKEGIILKYNESDYQPYLVEFDDDIQGGHSGGGSIDSVRGWWCKLEELELIIKMESKDFYNTKVRVENPQQSQEIQKKMFELGFEWNGGSKKIDGKYMVFLYFSSERKITYSGDNGDDYFNTHKFLEVTPQQILNHKPIIKKQNRKKKYYLGIISCKSGLREIEKHDEKQFKSFHSLTEMYQSYRIFKIYLTDKQYRTLNSLKDVYDGRKKAEKTIKKNPSLIWLSKEVFNNGK